MTGSWPLLHIAQATVNATTFDARVITCGVLALFAIGFVSAAPWLLPRLRSIARRRHALRAARMMLAVLVFFAVLPAVLPYDHLFLHESASDAERDAVHVAHCHVTPGACADQPVPSGPGQLMLSDPLLVVPAMLAMVILLSLPTLAAFSRKPDVPPPVLLSTTVMC